MTEPDVRAITDDDLIDYLRCIGVAFHFGPEVSDERLAFTREHFGDLSRRFGAFVDGALCGTAGSRAVDLTVPGQRTVPIAAVTQVTVLPTHRRRGLLAAMMRRQLADCVERGDVAAMLIAAEWPIYGRYGYGMATEAAATVVDARGAQFREPALEGTLELVDPPTLCKLAPEIFDRHRITSPGAITRDADSWPIHTDVTPRPGMDVVKQRVRVIRRDSRGEPDGYAVYDPDEHWVHNRPEVKLAVREMITATPAAQRDLWRYLCAVDWVNEVHAGVRPVDEDVRPLLVDGRAARQTERSDHMWVRLLDVTAALAGRTYEAPVSLVLDVHDPYLGRGGRFRLEADDTSAVCTTTNASPDVSLGADVLGAVYLGGSPLAPYILASRIDEHTPGAVAQLDRAMRTARAPWATTNF